MARYNKHWKGWGREFVDAIFGSGTTTHPYEKERRRKEKENKRDEVRFGKAMSKLEKEHRENRKYYGYDD